MDYIDYMPGIKPGKPKTTPEKIKKIEKELGCVFEPEYIDFLLEMNGCEGLVGDTNYIVLWPVETLKKRNEEYEVPEYADGMLIFGSDGGGEAFAFDIKKKKTTIVRMPFVGMSRREAVPIAKTFSEFIAKLALDDIFAGK